MASGGPRPNATKVLPPPGLSRRGFYPSCTAGLHWARRFLAPKTCVQYG